MVPDSRRREPGYYYKRIIAHATPCSPLSWCPFVSMIPIKGSLSVSDKRKPLLHRSDANDATIREMQHVMNIRRDKGEPMHDHQGFTYLGMEIVDEREIDRSVIHRSSVHLPKPAVSGNQLLSWIPRANDSPESFLTAGVMHFHLLPSLSLRAPGEHQIFLLFFSVLSAVSSI
jgi:hypothetical protein